MQLVAITTIILLIIMAVFHFYWALDGTFGLNKVLPTKDGKRLLNPSKLLTLMVGILLIGFAVIAYLLQYSIFNSSYLVYSGWVLSIIFTARAIGDFNAVGLFKTIKSTEFAEYDTKYFSPLCISLGIAFALLSYQVE